MSYLRVVDLVKTMIRGLGILGVRVQELLSEHREIRSLLQTKSGSAEKEEDEIILPIQTQEETEELEVLLVAKSKFKSFVSEFTLI